MASGLSAAVLSVALVACGDEDRVIDCSCAGVQQKAWFEGVALAEWGVHRSDDPTVVAAVPMVAEPIRWTIDEESLTAVTDGDGPPVEVASFEVLAHLSAEPDASVCCGYRSIAEQPWTERGVFRVDFSRTRLPPPGLFVQTAEVEPGGLLTLLDIDDVGIHVGADGGVLPLAFVARASEVDEWARVVVWLRWGS